MTLAHLAVEAASTGAIRYRFSSRTEALEVDGPDADADLERWHRRAAREWQSARVTGDGGLMPLVQRFVDLAIPRALARALRAWASTAETDLPEDPARGAAVATLCVRCNRPFLALLPWEAVPLALGARAVSVVRAPWLPEPETEPATPANPQFQPVADELGVLPPPPRVLVIGPGHERGRSAPGAYREVTELPERFKTGGLAVTVLDGVAPTGLESALHVASPDVLHLAPIAANVNKREPSVLLRGDDGAPTWIPAGQLCRPLSLGAAPRLVVVNAGPDGLSTARVLSEKANVAAVGWLGSVGGDLAADFALFFYRRLIEEIERTKRPDGSPLASAAVGAVCAFLRYLTIERALELGAVPVVWIPSAGDAPEIHLPPAAAPIPPGNLGDFEISLTAGVDLVLPPAINPALLANGVRAIDRLSISLSSPMEGVRLRITCDTGTSTSTVHRTLSLPAGSSRIETNDLQFPALHSALQAGPGRRQVNFTVSVLGKERTLAEETRSTVCMSTVEWLDTPHTRPFLPAFVLPQSEAVLRIIGDAHRVLRIIAGAEADFSAYARDDRQQVRLQMRALFQTLQQEPYRLQYVPPPPDLVHVSSSAEHSASRTRAGQIVRMPDEVVKRGRGTCHDLSLLLAACAEQVGIHAIVVLVRGHTFLGYWTDQKAHAAFWKRASTPGASPGTTGGREEPFGSRWILSSKELEKLTRNRDVELLEATFVTKPKSFEDACKEGEGRFFDEIEGGFDAAIDIRASRRWILPVV